MAVADADVAPIERELLIYEKGIPELLEVDDGVLKLIEKEDFDPASNRSARIPLLTAIRGTFQKYDPDGGSYGATSGPVWNVATLVPYYFSAGYSYTQLAQYATSGAQRGIKDVTKEVMKYSTKQFRAALDVLVHTDGSGVLGTITSVSTNTFTMTTDGYREQMVYIGQPVQVFNSALTTDRGSSTVTAIDRAAHTVTVAAAPGGSTGTDKLLMEGLAATVTIQSSLFGIQYHQSDATSGTWLGLNRANVSNVVCPSVNANSSSLTTAFIRQAINRIRMNIGVDAMNDSKTKLTVLTHPTQADAYESLAITISSIFKQPTGNQGVDLMFNNENGMTMGNLKVVQSIHQDRTRLDFLALGYWGRIVGTDTGFVRPGGNDQIIWPEYDVGVTGTLKASKFFYLNSGLQLYNRNPLAGSYVKTLAIPSGSIY